jgi:hypothetical protein
MNGKRQMPHPFAKVDLAHLGEKFLGLVEQARAQEESGANALTKRERQLCQFGLLVGHGEWDLARDCLKEFQNAGMAQQAFIEAAHIRGSLVLSRLGLSLDQQGLEVPSDMPEVVKTIKRYLHGAGNLTVRESFALGLGLTWGAGCWNT